MKVVFLGTGEAFDPLVPNSSVLILGESSNVLVDCGFTTPPQIWSRFSDSEIIDAIYITHFHGDHCFGLPALFLRMHEDGRRKPLVILGQQGTANRICSLLDKAYAGWSTKLSFELTSVNLNQEKPTQWQEFEIRIAPTIHGIPNMAVRLDSATGSVMVSGDGEITDSSANLAKGVDLLVHEAFSVEGHVKGHSSIKDVQRLVKQSSCGLCAVTHIRRDQRNLLHRIELMRGLLVPSPGTVLTPGSPN